MLCLFQIIFIFLLIGHQEMLGTEYAYPQWSHYIGYALTASSIFCIPIYIVYKFIITPGRITEVSTKRLTC